MYRPCRSHARIEFDLAKSSLVPGDILLQKSKQRLGLLRAKINALKVADLDLGFALLLQSSKNHEKIPDVHPHLDTVGVGFAIIGCVAQLHVRLCRNGHRRKCNYLWARKGSGPPKIPEPVQDSR